MQHTLLGFAFALIVAIVAAIAAPLFIDWNAWRPTFEQRVSALVGAPVSINGPIEATVLPVPAFTLRNVVIGDADRETGLKGSEIRGILSLGALLRASIEAEEIVFTKPEMRLALDEQGRILLNGDTGRELGSFSISRIAIQSGTLLIDRGNAGQFRFENVSATGELQSRTGPLRLDASFIRDGRSWNLRASTGQFGTDDTARFRTTLTRLDNNFSFDADGNLSLAGAQPRFDGKLNMAGRSPSNLLWKLSANSKASGQSVNLDALEIAVGNESPLELSGKATFEPRRGGKVEAELSANRIDLDKTEENQKPRDVRSAFPPVRDAVQLASGLSFAGKLRLSIGQLQAGGQIVRDLRSELALRDGFVAPEKLEARLPGRGSISVSGVAKDSNLDGSLKLSAEDAVTFARWLGLDAAGITLDKEGPLSLEGRVQFSAKQIAMEPLNFKYAGARVTGAMAYLFSDDKRGVRVAAKLNADALDLDVLAPAWQKFLGGPSVADVIAELSVSAPRLLGQAAKRFDVAFSRAGDEISIEKIALEDLGGFSMRANGKIASYPEHSNGRVEFEGEAARADGINALISSVSNGDGGGLARKIATAAMPLRIAGTIIGNGSGPDAAIKAAINANDVVLTLAAQLDVRTANVLNGRLTADAQDAAKLVTLLGLPSPEPRAGQGRFEASIVEKKEGATPISASLVFPGVNLTGEGDFRIGAGGRVEPRLNLRLEATDLRALSIAAARVSNSVVPATATTRLVRSGEGIALEDFNLNLNDLRARGRIALSNVSQPTMSGDLSFNRADFFTLVALGIGYAAEGSPWPEQTLGPRPFDGINGALDIESAALRLTGPLVATGTRLKLQFDKAQMKIEEFSGDLAGGKITGKMKITRDQGLSVSGGFSLVSADIARLMAPGTWRSIAKGKTTVGMELAAQGGTPAQLAANLSGRGNIVVHSLEIEKLDPDAIASVLASVSSKESPSASEVNAAFEKALSDGSLQLTKIDVPIVIAQGTARMAKMKTASGSTQVSSESSFDIAKLNLDAAVEFEGAPPKGMNARPAATVKWSGPLSRTERSVDISPLLTVLSLRSMDAEMRRIDGRDSPLSASALGSPAIESSIPQAPATAVPLPRKRPVDVNAPSVSPLPPPIDIGPAPGTPRPVRMN